MEKSQGSGSARCGLFLSLVSVVLLICASQDAAAAVQHQVGGSSGSWSLPSTANVNYTTWASTQTFSLGDTLYFNYSRQHHNVLQVTEANYDKCSTSSPIATWDDGATIVQLNKTGTFYFICGFPGHCDQGQKVAVLVQASNSSSSTSTPAPNSAPASPSMTTLSLLASLLAFSLIFYHHLLP